MSRSNPQLTNPAEHFFEWAGGKGLLTWYNKEKKENIQVKLPFTFLVIDELSTIGGYNKADKSGFWSNEVRSTKTDELFVRTKKGPFEAGLYENLTQTRAKGGKYVKSIYLIHKIGDDWVMGCFKAGGSALSAWIEFSKTCVVQNGKVVMTRGAKQEAPTGEFYPPEFKYESADPAENDEAIRFDKELQIYLSQYLSAAKVDDNAHGTGEDDALATPEQKADYEERRASRSAADDFENGEAGDDEPVKPAKRAAPALEDEIGDEPINLDDIPF